jgi:hypothetical protein
MTTPREHPLVRDYLARFDTVAAEVEPERRRRLREDIAEHLHETVGADADETEAAEAIRLLGTPEEIVGVEAAAPATVDDRLVSLTRIIAGAMLIASASLGLLVPGGGLLATRLLFSVAVIWLAAGPGSVTARRPLGTIALVALGVVGAADLVTDNVVGLLLAGAQLAAGADTGIQITTGMQLLQLVLAVVAAVQIARAGVVPRAWRWIPLWVLVAMTAVNAAGWIAVLASGSASLIVIATIGSPSGLVQVAGTILLGVLTILFGARTRR